jgi:hypothetical protein
MEIFTLENIKTLEVLAPPYLDYAFEQCYEILCYLNKNFKGQIPHGFCALEDSPEYNNLYLFWKNKKDELVIEILVDQKGELDIWMYEQGIEESDPHGLYFENNKDVADYIAKLLKRFLITKDKNLDKELREIELKNR